LLQARLLQKQTGRASSALAVNEKPRHTRAVLPLTLSPEKRQVSHNLLDVRLGHIDRRPKSVALRLSPGETFI
jgi:hypothetical protein